jgi:hypothetical protein
MKRSVKDWRKAYGKLKAMRGTRNIWLPDLDLNQDKQIQSLLCYRYTIGQFNAARKIEGLVNQSSRERKAQAMETARAAMMHHPLRITPCASPR